MSPNDFEEWATNIATAVALLLVAALLLIPVTWLLVRGFRWALS